MGESQVKNLRDIARALVADGKGPSGDGGKQSDLQQTIRGGGHSSDRRRLARPIGSWSLPQLVLSGRPIQ
jgi:hypothetical protein